MLGTVAVRRSRPELAVLGLAAGALGLGTTWWTAAPAPGTSLVLAATGVLGLEGAAVVLRRDRFWRPIITPLAVVAELLATVALAAQFHSIVWVVLGTTLGMMIANVPVVFLGDALIRRVPLKVVRVIAALSFVALGAYALLSGR